nr:putative glycoside hydrolase [uncultured Allomuricauda sp.]
MALNRIKKNKRLVLSLIFVFGLGSSGFVVVQAQTNFKISNGSFFKPKKFYPKFSWETTSMYYMFGDTKGVLTRKQVKSIASKTDFICIEKSHGLEELGAAELGAKHDAAAFKKIKPDIKVQFYFNSAYAWPFTSFNKNFTPKNINQYPGLKKFLIKDPQTGALYHRNNVYYFDVLNPELRKWWVETVAEGVRISGCDGAFIDQMHGFHWLRKEKSGEVKKAMGVMMDSLKRKLGPNKILLGNNAHTKIAEHVFPVVDAVMFEHYKEEFLTKESLLKDWEDMLKIAKAGKISVFRIGVEYDPVVGDNPDYFKNRTKRHERLSDLSHERLEYYHACYLIGAQPYSYFQYGWGWKLSTGSLERYKSLEKPLGMPKGPYQRLSLDGWEFTREFEHASVWVNTETAESKISWH